MFWINPPVAVLSVGLLGAFAPQDRREPRAFEVIGAVILASALGSLAWALSQIGPSETAAENVTVSASANTVIAAGLGVGGLVAYAFWERASNHPMTPPRLLKNQSFVGLNLATLMSYVGLSIMFFTVVTNIAAPLHKHAAKALKTNERGNDLALPRELEPMFSP